MSSRSVAVFGSSSTVPGSDPWNDAERLGRQLAAAGFAVRTGGYGGSMEAVSAGARMVGNGTAVVGVTLPDLFPDRSGPNPHLTEEIAAPTLLARIDALIAPACACVALPGSLGTFTELMAAWNQVFLARRLGRAGAPLVAVGSGWSELIEAVVSATGTRRDGVFTVPRVDAVVALLERLPSAE